VGHLGGERELWNLYDLLREHMMSPSTPQMGDCVGEEELLSSCFDPASVRKRRENGENVNTISEHRLHGSQLGRAVNWLDRLRTSADKQVLSGCRAVVIV